MFLIQILHNLPCGGAGGGVQKIACMYIEQQKENPNSHNRRFRYFRWTIFHYGAKFFTRI